ncbi:hypothetical protein QBC42DRAFT_271880, partial [Cladorrhinum samala]
MIPFKVLFLSLSLSESFGFTFCDLFPYTHDSRHNPPDPEGEYFPRMRSCGTGDSDVFFFFFFFFFSGRNSHQDLQILGEDRI